MIRYFKDRPQLVDLGLAIGFLTGFFGFLIELANQMRVEHGLIWGGLMASTGTVQWILCARAMAKNPEDFGGGLI